MSDDTSHVVEYVFACFARELERELAAITRERDFWRQEFEQMLDCSEAKAQQLASMTADRNSWQQQADMHATHAAELLEENARLVQEIAALNAIKTP